MNVLKILRTNLERARSLTRADGRENHPVTTRAVDRTGRSAAQPLKEVVRLSGGASSSESGFHSNLTQVATDVSCHDNDETVLPGTDDEDSFIHRPQHWGDELDDGRRIIPETVPLDLYSDPEDDPTRINTQKFFKSSVAPCSPIKIPAPESAAAPKVATPVTKVR